MEWKSSNDVVFLPESAEMGQRQSKSERLSKHCDIASQTIYWRSTLYRSSSGRRNGKGSAVVADEVRKLASGINSH
jgi:transposase-like protein